MDIQNDHASDVINKPNFDLMSKEKSILNVGLFSAGYVGSAV